MNLREEGGRGRVVKCRLESRGEVVFFGDVWFKLVPLLIPSR